MSEIKILKNTNNNKKILFAYYKINFELLYFTKKRLYNKI